MKKILLGSVLFMALWSCKSSTNDNNPSNDTVGATNPSAIDTTQHPNGITNGSVISTDTAAMKVQTDSTHKEVKKY